MKHTKMIRFIQYFGVFLFILAMVFNPVLVRFLFAQEKYLSTIHLIDVILLEVFLVVIGILMLTIKSLIVKFMKSALLRNISLSFAVIFLMIFFIEVSCYLLLFFSGHLNEHNSLDISSKGNYFSFDKDLGYKGKPNFQTNITRLFKNGSIIFDVSYTLDKFGRRITPLKKSRKSLIVFGGSFVFGDGLEDNETFPYQLSEMTGLRVYNYGMSGYGAQQMLANLNRKEFYSEIEGNDSDALYRFIEPHLDRAVGNMRVYNGWGFDFPYYYLDDKNQIHRDGSFTTGRPILSVIYRILGRSNFIKYFEISIPFQRDDYDSIYLTYKIIEKSRDVFESKFNGTFYVLMVPPHCNSTLSTPEDIYAEESYEKLSKLLEASNITVLKYCLDLIEEYVIPNYSGHPNSLQNKKLAEMVKESII